MDKLCSFCNWGAERLVHSADLVRGLPKMAQIPPNDCQLLRQKRENNTYLVPGISMVSCVCHVMKNCKCVFSKSGTSAPLVPGLCSLAVFTVMKNKT